MKRSLFCFLFILLTFGLSSLTQAAVTGMCSHCHTMHNSQGGEQFVDFVAFEGYTDANPSLLRATCVGCHSSVATDVWQDSLTMAPIVYNTQEPNFNTAKGLAAGNFYWVLNGNSLYPGIHPDRFGHNVDVIAEPDTIFASGAIPGSSPSTDYFQLTCAGEFGCHGDRSVGNNDLDAVRSAHHTDDSGPRTEPTSVGAAYRFLYSTTPVSYGIEGLEDSDWEQNATGHNEYKGAIGDSDTTTISYFCAQCHGSYHSAAGVGRPDSPWLRHPTNVLLSKATTSEYHFYNGDYGGTTGTYSMTAPIARQVLPGEANLSVDPESDIVMCLSCHRAHGSPNFKMIRWDNTGGMLGCNVCHTSKK